MSKFYSVLAYVETRGTAKVSASGDTKEEAMQNLEAGNFDDVHDEDIEEFHCDSPEILNEGWEDGNA